MQALRRFFMNINSQEDASSKIYLFICVCTDFLFLTFSEVKGDNNVLALLNTGPVDLRLHQNCENNYTHSKPLNTTITLLI